MVDPIPEGYHSVTPYIVVKDAKAAIKFYIKAFNAIEMLRLDSPDGKIAHAEVRIGDSHVMLADEHPEMGAVCPDNSKGTAFSLMIYTEHPDEMFEKAISEGAEVLRPMVDQFYGDRSGIVRDPFGHSWTIACHIEDVSEEEINKRFEEMFHEETN